MEAMNNAIADALDRNLTSPNEADRNLESANVVDGLFAIARGLRHVANALEKLGGADTNTPMGAIEALSKEVKEGFLTLANELSSALIVGERK